MFEKTKRKIIEPVAQTARLAVAALLIAIAALIAAVFG